MTYRLLKEMDDEAMPLILSVYDLPSVSRFISIDKTRYWQYVTTAENVRFYKVYKNGILAATAHCETADRILYMDVVVFPEHQRKGIATGIIRDIQKGMTGLDFDVIRVSIDESNIASIRTFEKTGFTRVSRDEELLEYEYVLYPSPRI